MTSLRTIALVVALGVGAVLYPLVAPSAPPGTVEAARKALAAGDYDSAIALYTNVLQSERLDTALLAAVYQERGVARHKSGTPVTAIADYTNSIWLGVLPDSLLARSFLDRGIAYVEVGELIRARRDFDNAIAKDPHLADAYFGRATVLRLLGNPQEALGDYDEALRLGHEHAHLVYFGRGLAQEAVGADRRAAADHTEAALRAPDFRPARTRLAALGARVPSDEEAQAYALTMRKGPPRREPVPPVASIALADAGEILTVGGTEASESTGAISAAGPPTVLSSAKPPGPGAKPGFLRPSRDAVLAEHAVKANLRAGEPAFEPEAVEAADAETPTGAVPPPAREPEIPPDETVTSAPAPAETAAAPPPQPPSSGRFYVQLGAYADAATADRGTENFKARFSEIAARHEMGIESAKIAGRGIVYRVRLGPLATEEETRALCDSLRRQAQPCVPVIPPKRG